MSDEIHETTDKQTISGMEPSNDYKYFNLNMAQFGLSIVNKGDDQFERTVIHVATPRFIPTKTPKGNATKAFNIAVASIEMDTSSARKLRDVLNRLLPSDKDDE